MIAIVVIFERKDSDYPFCKRGEHAPVLQMSTKSPVNNVTCQNQQCQSPALFNIPQNQNNNRKGKGQPTAAETFVYPLDGMISNTAINHCCFYFNKALSAETWKRVQWMNKKAPPREAYLPTPVEHIANVFTHGVWVIPSVFATLELLERSHNGAQTMSALVYGATLVFLFSISTSFHCSFFCNQRGKLKDVLHRCDRAMIYVFIAGSYFPWLTLEQLPKEGWASSMNWIVWCLAVLGIIYQQTFHEKFKTLETCFYLFMGIGPALLLISEHDVSGLSEVQLGGIFYMIGVMFFKCDGVIPCAHAIWHLFVAMAAGIHYFAIRNHLFPTLPRAASVQYS